MENEARFCFMDYGCFTPNIRIQDVGSECYSKGDLRNNNGLMYLC